MNSAITATLTVEFGRSGCPQHYRQNPPGRVARVARLLALAHAIDRRIQAGEFDDLAAAARAFGLTRARVTQIVNLTLLAPPIQAEILAWPPIERGRDPVTERALRPIVAEADWERQIEMWNLARGTQSGCLSPRELARGGGSPPYRVAGERPARS